MTRTMPSTFSGFRIRLAAAMRRAGVDKTLCAMVSDVNYEGDGVADECFRAWSDFQSEWKEELSRKASGVATEFTWEEVMQTFVHDCVIDLVCDYLPKNSRDRCKEFAKVVVKEMLGITLRD